VHLRQYSESRWKDIANLVLTRNHVQCLQRWKKVRVAALSLQGTTDRHAGR
ncbi:unnamed protein product, partial [Laminaria digitata]